MVCCNLFNFSRLIYRFFSSSIYKFSFNANKFPEQILEIGKTNST